MPQVVIGICPQCGRDLKVKEHAPRAHMNYTCTCGWHGRVDVAQDLLARAEALRDQGAGRSHKVPPTAWQRLRRWFTAWRGPTR